MNCLALFLKFTKLHTYCILASNLLPNFQNHCTVSWQLLTAVKQHKMLLSCVETSRTFCMLVLLLHIHCTCELLAQQCLVIILTLFPVPTIEIHISQYKYTCEACQQFSTCVGD